MLNKDSGRQLLSGKAWLRPAASSTVMLFKAYLHCIYRAA